MGVIPCLLQPGGGEGAVSVHPPHQPPPQQPGQKVGRKIPQRRTEENRKKAGRTKGWLPVVFLITSTQPQVGEDRLAQWFGGGRYRGFLTGGRGTGGGGRLVVYKVQETWVN